MNPPRSSAPGTSPPFVVVPELEEIPWLVHGFGTRRFFEADLDAFGGSRGLETVQLDQVHSGTVRVIDAVPATRLRGDALAADRPGLLLAVRTADCLPLLLVDERRRAVAAIHAGWRGTSRNIAGRAVAVLAERFGSVPADLRAALGPCIAGPCYEVGPEVRRAFDGWSESGEFFAPAATEGKFLLDVRAANVGQLRAAGVPAGRIGHAAACTHCEPGLFSFRRDRDVTARLFSFIGILP
jgi:hypothetical protein